MPQASRRQWVTGLAYRPRTKVTGCIRVPMVLTELTTVDRTLKLRAAGVLARFDRPAPPGVRLEQSTAG
jgi:hypothetical protein